VTKFSQKLREAWNEFFGRVFKGNEKRFEQKADNLGQNKFPFQSKLLRVGKIFLLVKNFVLRTNYDSGSFAPLLLHDDYCLLKSLTFPQILPSVVYQLV